MNPQVQRTSIEFWSRLEGHVANGYPLNRSLGRGDSHATYITEYGQDARPAVIKLIDASSRAALTQRTRWSAISQLSHPNLIPVLDYGQCEIDSIPVLYFVTGWAEDNLDSVLARRSLTVGETKELLGPMLSVLGYLHERGLVHAAIKPSNVLANGDRLQLSSDSITPAGEVNAGHESSAYGPPESNPGIVSFPGDIWSLGLTLAQSLTQKVPDPASQNGGSAVESEFAASSNLPDPFSDIVRHCLRRDPDIRWTIPQIASRLRGPSPAPSRVNVPEPPRPLATEPARRPKWLYPLLAGVVAMIVIFALLYGKKQANSRAAGTSKTASIEKTTEEPRPAEAAESHAKPDRPSLPEPETAAPMMSTARPRTDALPTPAKPSPFGKSGKSAARAPEGTGWFVVTATYGKRKDAEKRAASMKHQWPKFNPEVYPPADAPHYIVVLGANLSREAASALQSRAVAAGLPRDTYITNRLGTK